MYKIITIQGPTASGKSGLALKLINNYDIEIISADSRQVFKHLDIGTAKPTKVEQELVPHHLIDIVEPNEVYNAGRFAKDAAKLIIDITKKSKIPIFCGGTGFYIQALTDGLAKIPDIDLEVKTKVAAIIEENGLDYLWSELLKVEPEAKERMHKNDINRIMRSYEVFLQTGKTITYYWKNQKPELDLDVLSIYLNPDRVYLYPKINERVDRMMEMGLYEEFTNILDLGYKESDPGLNTVGYKELFGIYSGSISLNEGVELIKRNTRRYAKRQFTWFNAKKFDLTNDLMSEDFNNIIKAVDQFLEK